LKKANGKGSLTVFLKNVQQAVNSGDIDTALAGCDKQRGSCANVLRAGLEKYKMVVEEGDVKGQKELMESIKDLSRSDYARSAHAGKKPIDDVYNCLYRNNGRIARTVIGMIRAFQAMGRAGALMLFNLP